VISNAVTYSHAATTIVSAVDPQFGPSIGNDIVHISGTNFGTTVTVTIDGISCVLMNQTATDLFCTTGRRSSPPTAGNSFIVNSDGNNAKISTTPYLYIDRWSNAETWGG